MATETQKSSNRMHYVHFGVTLLLMFGFRFLPAPAPITPYGMAILGIFIGIIYGWTTSGVGLTWTALAALVALGVTTGYGTVGKALASIFASDTVMLILVGMFMMGPIQKSNIGEWLVTKVMTSKLVDGKPWRFTIAICVGTGMVGFLSNSFVVALFMLTIFNTIFTQAGYKKGDKYPVMLTIGMFISLMAVNVVFPFRGWALNCISAFAGASGGLTLDFGKFMMVSIPFYFVVTLGYVALMFVMRCDVSKMANMDLSEYKKKYEFGLNKYQRTVLIIVIVWIVACMVASFAGGTEGIRLLIKNFGVQGVILATIIAFFIIKIDGEPIITVNECNQYFMWDMVYVIASGMLMASLLTSQETGVSAFISSYIGPFLAGRSEYIFLLMVGMMALVLTNFLNNIAIMFIMMALLSSLYAQGILSNIYTGAMVVSIATILAFYTPAASAYGAMIHSAQFSVPSKIYQYGLFIFLYLFIIMGVVVIPLSNLVF